VSAGETDVVRTSRLPWLALAALLVWVSLVCGQPTAPLPRESNKPDERLPLSPQEQQKLLEQIEQLKKELASRKIVAPSGCALHAKIEKRGDTSIATLKLTYTFRTTLANSAVTLGAKRAFLVSAQLNGQPTPAIESGDAGFLLPVDAAGNHTAVLDVECPIQARGGKPEIGFELGLPRAAITTLILEPPPGVTRVSITTRTPEAGKAGEPKRTAGLDVKLLAAPPPNRGAYPIGAVDSLELGWEPPVAGPATDAGQTAEIDSNTIVNESQIETTARVKLRGTSRSWRVAAPVDATVSAERPVGGNESESPSISKPADAANPVWKIDFAPGSTPTDWTIIVRTRIERPKPTDAGFRGPFSASPPAVLDAVKSAGTLRVSAPANTRLTFKHGREVRQDVPPTAPAEDETMGFFRFATGPGGTPPPTPLLSFEAAPLLGRVAIRPQYRFSLTDSGWNVRAEIRVVPIRTSVSTVDIELPSEWRGVELGPPNLVESNEELKLDGKMRVLRITLAGEHRQPFELSLLGTLPLVPGVKDVAMILPRFPNAAERDSLFTITVPEGTEVRGTGREWDGGQPATWTHSLTPPPGADGKPQRNITTLTGKFDRGLARLDLAWAPFRPPVTSEVRAELTLRGSQVVVSERVVLKSPDALPRVLRFDGAVELPGLAPFERVGPGSWQYNLPADQKEAVVRFEYAVPIPAALEGRPRRVPVPLVLPMGASRTDATARVWVVSGGRTVSVPAPGPWRELPPDPAAERESLPALSLVASGSELPLVLEVSDVPTDAAAVWIERTLIQTSRNEDGTAVRSRFLLRRWFTDSLEIKLPADSASGTPEVYLDEPPKRIPATVRNENGERLLRVPLPEPRIGKPLMVDVRFTTSKAIGGEVEEYFAPRPLAQLAGPVRWQVAGPAGTTPLLLGGERSEQHWQRRFGMIVPAPASNDDLERWLLNGSGDSAESGPLESAVVRPRSAERIAFLHVPRLAFIVGCSVSVLLVGLILSRLPGWLSGPAVAVLAAAVAVATVMHPQPASQTAAAAEPGFVALMLVLAVQVAARWRHRQRITHLPGFTRSIPNLNANGPPSATGSRPSDRGPQQATTGALIPQPASTGS
jgi:hypothetical protein